MIRQAKWLAPAILALALALPATAQAQGQGRGKDGDQQKAQQKQVEKGPQKAKQDNRGKGSDKAQAAVQKRQDKQDDGRGKGQDKADRGARGRADVDRGNNNAARFTGSGRARDRVAGAAIERARGRGVTDDQFVISPDRDRVRIKNRSGDVLVDLDDDRARRIGAWDVRPAIDRGDANAPAFCRSGAGHPVWGRQWCIDKGFGLGRTNDVRWGSARTIGDVIFGRTTNTGRLTREDLLLLLGDVAFNRLALQAVTLGYADPLTGVWVADQSGPRVLQINSGGYPLAEIVDANRDNRADMLVVALRPY